MSGTRGRVSGKDARSDRGQADWLAVCGEDDLVIGAGVCARFEGEQVALFRESAGGPVYAISNYDPIGKANVLSRGIIGSLGEQRVVASPLFKQHFDLSSGQCLEQPELRVPTWRAKVEDGIVYLRHGSAGATD